MTEWEIYTYQDINNLTGKSSMRTRHFFEYMVNYKMSKVSKSVDLPNIIRRVNNFKFLENNQRVQIRNKIAFNYTPLEFCESIVTIWYDSNIITIKKVQDIVAHLEPKLEEFSVTASNLIVIIKNTKVLMFKLYNLFRIFINLQNSFELEGI
jgi:hypothetical protein